MIVSVEDFEGYFLDGNKVFIGVWTSKKTIFMGFFFLFNGISILDGYIMPYTVYTYDFLVCR